MLFVLGFTGFFVVLACLLPGRDKPSPLRPDLWDADTDVARANHEAAVAAWRRGEHWTPARRLARLPDVPMIPAAIRDPNGERSGRWQRCCAMHAPRWRED